MSARPNSNLVEDKRQSFSSRATLREVGLAQEQQAVSSPAFTSLVNSMPLLLLEDGRSAAGVVSWPQAELSCLATTPWEIGLAH